MSIHKTVFCLSCLLTASALGQSANDMLYDPDPPPNSAFVRLINATGTDVTASLGAKKVSADKRGASPYVVVPQGTLNVNVGTASSKVSVRAGSFYTLALSGAPAPKLTLLTDATSANRAKALIAVYNLSSLASVDFKTADGKVTVIEGVAPNTTKSRAVNGVKVDLAMFDKSGAIATFKDTQLERGAAYAVIVSDTGGKPTASWTQSATTTR